MLGELQHRLTAERLRQLLHYSPETGLFYWRVSRGGVAEGTEAGTWQGNGYRKIHINGVPHLAHRLAWLYFYCERATGEIDHRNKNPADNRIANLRDSSRAQNARNTNRRNRRSGFKGVARHGGKWRARIAVDGKQIELGIFSTAEEAAAAYDDAARLYYGEFARTNEILGLLAPAARIVACAEGARANPRYPPSELPRLSPRSSD